MGKVDIDAVKNQNPLAPTVERLCGQAIIKHKIFAPWRAESTPSVHIYEDDSWWDYGAGVGGDVLDFMGYYYFGLSYDPSTHFIDVIDKLGALEIAPLPPQPTKPKPARPKLKVSLQSIIGWADSMPANRRAYWHSRGLTDQTINEFMLGFDGQRYTIPALYRYIPFGVKRRITPEDSATQYDLHNAYVQSVRELHPEWTEETDAKVYAYSVLELRESHPDWTDYQIQNAAPPAPTKYTSTYGSRPGIFNSDTLLSAHTVVICEGEIDAMLLHQSDIQAVSSTGGAGKWEERWATHFTHIPRIFVLYDNDEAGQKGALKVQASIRRAQILTLPDGVKDVGELFQGTNSAADWVRWQVGK